MPKTRDEDDKKQGDKLESLIERMGGNPSPRKNKESADDDDPALLPDDDDPAFEDDDDPAYDDDEDVLGDDVEARRDVGEPD